MSGADPSTTPERAPAMSGQHGLPPGHSCWLVRMSCRRCWDWITGVPRCDGCPACSRSEKLRSVSQPSRRRGEPKTRSRGCARSAPLTGPRRSSCSRVLLSVRSLPHAAGRSSPPTLAAPSPESAPRPNCADDEQTRARQGRREQSPSTGRRRSTHRRCSIERGGAHPSRQDLRLHAARACDCSCPEMTSWPSLLLSRTTRSPSMRHRKTCGRGWYRWGGAAPAGTPPDGLTDSCFRRTVPSATDVIAELQDLNVGDFVPDGRARNEDGVHRRGARPEPRARPALDEPPPRDLARRQTRGPRLVVDVRSDPNRQWESNPLPVPLAMDHLAMVVHARRMGGHRPRGLRDVARPPSRCQGKSRATRTVACGRRYARVIRNVVTCPAPDQRPARHRNAGVWLRGLGERRGARFR